STNTSKVDISSLPKGVYFISLKMKNETVYRKIIRM
ncbi:MAG: T9SS type A sorting domain-containing protein, partial [Cytophagia bacterium]|nr:T9SS type A sorting domain-containing protein [Cytophagia bacterium]